MSTIQLTANEEMTAALARMLAATARPGQVFLLDGPVGAGKTHFARAFIRARQGDAAEDIPSPTFTLVQTYADPMGTEIWHADLYRLTDPSELDELGLEEAQDNGICLIEWPDRLEVLPENAVTIAISNHADPDLRNIALVGGDLDRLAVCAQFLHDAGWGEARVMPLAGDASARRYFRLNGPKGRAVLMDDPSGDVERFVTVTHWLRGNGFGAPELFAEDQDAGLLLLEDLGDDLVARLLELQPAKVSEIYHRITDFLVELHRLPAPDFLTHLDGKLLAEQVGLFAEWYPQAVGADTTAADKIAPLINQLHDELIAEMRPVFCMRDFHAENLIWRGEAPLGLIDYQDAVACHPAYDLVSVLQDARREIPLETEVDCLARYLTTTGLPEDRFRAAYALLGAQRNLRIMGIFTRLCIRDGKPRYLDFMPRVWGYILRNLDHPALAPLAAIIDTLPGPDPQTIERIRRQCARL